MADVKKNGSRKDSGGTNQLQFRISSYKKLSIQNVMLLIPLFFLCVYPIIVPSNIAGDDLNTQVPHSISSRNNSSEKSDSDVKKRFTEYRRWNMKNLYPLACEAENHGLSATERDIADQETLLESVFPGIRGSGLLVKNEILARKYTQSVLGIKTTQDEKEKAYKEISNDFSGETVPSQSDMAALIEMRAIVNCQVTKGEINRINEDKVRQRIKSDLNEKMWSHNDLRISADDDYCIAQHHDSGQCQLAVNKFNQLIKYCEYPKMIPLKVVRQQAVEEMLMSEYLINYARQKGFDKTDSSSNEISDWLKWSAHNEQFKYLGPEVRDVHILRSLYDQYYDLFFCTRKIPYYSLIGTSTDSLYIDSLAKLYATDQRRKKNDQKNRKKERSSKPVVPWSCSSGHLLPVEFDSIIDTLDCLAVSEAVRMPYGYFLVRFDSITVQHEIPFDEAYPKLVFIASKKKWENLDSVIAENSFQIYAANKSHYAVRDTLSLRFFLQPFKCDSTLSIPDKSDTTILKLVAQKGIRISSPQLPPDIRDSLFNYYNTDKKRKVFGPISTRYGTCYIKIESIKVGKGIISFSQVKKQLRDSLMVCAINSGTWAFYDKPDSLLVNKALGEVYSRRFFEMDEATKDTLISKRKNTGTKSNYIKNYHESRITEIRSWIENVTIRIPE